MIVAAAAAAAAVALGGCGGGSSGVAPAAYVKSVCVALGQWSTAIKSAGTHLQAAASGTNSLSAGKQQYQAFVAALVSATGSARDQLKAAGVPAVKHGSQISGALVTAFDNAKAGLANATSQAAAIPTTGTGAYQAAASRVTIGIRQALARMAAVHPQEDPALRTAAAKEPHCQALGTA